jgi:hypothetical protein
MMPDVRSNFEVHCNHVQVHLLKDSVFVVSEQDEAGNTDVTSNRDVSFNYTIITPGMAQEPVMMSGAESLNIPTL